MKTGLKSPVPDYPLQELNSWKVGGRADFFGQPKNREEILHYLRWAKQKKLPVTFLGGGTNVLISDKGVEGLVVSLTQLSSFQEYKEDGRLRVRALAGFSKARLMQIFLRHKLAPALFLCGLPGDVGGGVVMNAGAGQNIFPKEFKDIVDWLKVIKVGEKEFTGKPDNNLICKQPAFTVMRKDQIKWGYRFSEGWGPGLIYEVGMSWPLDPLPDLSARLKETALKRSASQPLQSASCGSVFKNPLTGEKAGALIEQCGLKGHQIGGAFVSKKHANFIVNTGDGSATDIHRLIQHVQKTVQQKRGVLLQPEVRFMGRWS